MTRNQQFIGSAFSKHVPTQHSVRYDNGVQPVHGNGLAWVQILQRFAVFTCERHVPANIACRAARLEPADHVTLRQLLMFDAEQRVSMDAPLSECPNCPPSQRQPQNAGKFLTTHGAI